MRALITIILSTLVSFTFAQGVWTKETEHPTLGGLFAPSAAIVNNKVYIAFGAFSDAVVTNEIWEYDLNANVWTSKTSFPGKPRYSAGTFVFNDNIYYATGTAGGVPYLEELWVYNVTSDSWTQKTSLPAAGRTGAIVFQINNKAYVLGGATGRTSFLNDFWEYDPILDQWTQKKSFSSSTIASAATFVINNNAYICSGKSNQNTYLDETWEYDPSQDQWTQKASLPAGSGTAAGVGFTLFDSNSNTTKGYYGLGVNTSPQAYIPTMYEYDVATDKWKTISDFGGKARYIGVSFVNNNTAYVGFGSSNSVTPTYEKDIWRLTMPAVFKDSLSIKGIIHEDADVLKNGKVIAYNLSNSTTYQTTTDLSGNFDIDSLSLGTYVLKALHNTGDNFNDTFYPAYTDSLKTIQITLGGSIKEIDLYMNSSATDSSPTETVAAYFSISPNPFSNYIKVIPLNSNALFTKIQIFNLTGGIQQEIYFDKNTSTYDIDMNNVDLGVYILKIETADGIYMKKVIKQ